MKLKYKVGGKVTYSIQGQHYFDGVIIGIDTNKNHKPYIIKTDAGEEKYANEKYLSPK